MNKYLLLFLSGILLSKASSVHAQSRCAMNITADSTCTLPVTMRVQADYGIYQIEWYRGGNLLQSYTREWDTSGTGVLVAGGNGQGPALSQVRPGGLRVDDSSILYIADLTSNNTIKNHRIFKWYQEESTGTIIADGFNAPNGSKFKPGDFAFDQNKDMYIVDDAGNRIIKWSIGATSGTNYAGIEGSPGTALTQFDNPNGVCYDTASDNLYVLDAFNSRLMQWSKNASSGSVIADDLYGNIQYIDIDLEGNLYISDFNNSRILRFAPGSDTGVTVAGSALGTQGNADTLLRFPEGVIVDGLQNLYIVDYMNHRVQMWPKGLGRGITIGGGNGQGPALNQLSFPNSITQDKWGNVFIGDLVNNRVLKYAPLPLTDTFVATEKGIYTVVVKAFNGCTVTETIDVSPGVEIPEITINGFNLGTTIPYATYQWLREGEPIPGATSSTYQIKENGAYSVIVSDENGCEGQSTPYKVDNVAIDHLGAGNFINIYPNPAQNTIHIQAASLVDVILTDISGRTIKTVTQVNTVNLESLHAGMYLLRILAQDGTLIKVVPFVKADYRI